MARPASGLEPAEERRVAQVRGVLAERVIIRKHRGLMNERARMLAVTAAVERSTRLLARRVAELEDHVQSGEEAARGACEPRGEPLTDGRAYRCSSCVEAINLMLAGLTEGAR